MMVLGRFRERSRAPTPSKTHRPEAGANASQDEARGGREKQQGAAAKECERGCNTHGTVGVARICWIKYSRLDPGAWE